MHSYCKQVSTSLFNRLVNGAREAAAILDRKGTNMVL